MSAVLLIGKNSLAREVGAALGRAGFEVFGEACERMIATTLRRLPTAVFIEICGDAAENIARVQCLRHQGYGGALFLLGGDLRRIEIVEALDAGADECLVPPLDELVVVARLRAVLRRSAPQSKPSTEAVKILPEDVPRWVCRGATKVRLTPTEARILDSLRKAGGCFVHSATLGALACPEAPLSRDSLQVHLVHLRRKLGVEGWRLENSRAHGYRFVECDTSAVSPIA